MSIGEKLTKLRKKKGLTQDEVAKKLNITRQALSMWENDRAVPGVDMLRPICDLYGISADELLNTSEDKDEVNETKEKECKKSCNDEFSLYGQLRSIFSLLTLIIYLGVSFMTMAWHITWIIWIIFALIMEIVKLIISLKENK